MNGAELMETTFPSPEPLRPSMPGSKLALSPALKISTDRFRRNPFPGGKGQVRGLDSLRVLRDSVVTVFTCSVVNN